MSSYILFPLCWLGRLLRAWTQQISLGKSGSPITSIPRILKGIWKSEDNLTSSVSPHGRCLFWLDTLILSHVYIVKFDDVPCLFLDLLGHFSVGVDLVALEFSENCT